jgi:hypothetical protein
MLELALVVAPTRLRLTPSTVPEHLSVLARSTGD